ncbi:MAG: S41 family peptidase [Flavobacterium sp.]
MKHTFKRFFTFCFLLQTIQGFTQQINHLQNGIWLQEGYDRVLTIKDTAYVYYNLDPVNCKALAEGNFKGRFSVVSITDSLLVLNPGGIVNYNFKRINQLPEICTKPFFKENSFEKNFEIFWLTFNNNYAFFKERKINWQKVHDNYLPRIKKINTEQEFALILQEIVKKINDGHIRLEIPENLISKTNQLPLKPKKSRNEVIQDIQKNYTEKIKSYNNGVIKWGFLQNSKSGYILITDMNNFANYVKDSEQDSKDFSKKYEAISKTKSPLEMFDDELKGVEKVMNIILDDFKGTQSIVIDLRFNGGGYETVALKLLSYFVLDKKEILSIKAKTQNGFSKNQHYTLIPAQNTYSKKVYLLTSHNTASAAEIFSLGTLNYPEIIRIGSPTAGIFSELLWKELPNGWEFSLSNEVYSDNKNKSYEGIGIPVNHEMHYSKDRSAFYNEFYNAGSSQDKTLEKVLRLEK